MKKKISFPVSDSIDFFHDFFISEQILVGTALGEPFKQLLPCFSLPAEFSDEFLQKHPICHRYVYIDSLCVYRV